MDPINSGGWYKVADLHGTDAKWTPKELFTIVMKNDKQRFQLAVHTVDGHSHKARRLVTKIYAIRCTGGHTIAVDPELLSAPFSAAKGKFVSAVVHATMQCHLAGIFRDGLKPGGNNMGRARRASNFNAYLPSDPRNEVEGRVGDLYDAIIVFDTARVLADLPMRISHSG
eukprot:10936200-Heterocapsa_arctica.AAC.1